MFDIQKIDIFKDLSLETQKRLKDSSTLLDLKREEVLFWEQDQIESIYILIEGKVTLLRYSLAGHKRIIFILDKGSLINEVVFDNAPVSVVCEAFEDSKVIAIHKTDMLNIMRDDFDLTQRIMCSMGKKQRRLYRQIKNSVSIRVDKKLAAKLWKLSRDYGTGQDEFKKLDLNINITKLSCMLGSSRETVSRAMKVLTDNELVEYKNKYFYVNEIKLLKYYRVG